MPSRAAMIASATSPSPMNLIRAPASRTWRTRFSCRGRSRMQTVTSSTVTPFALATRAMFSAGGAVMSTTPAASAPVASFSM